MMILQLSLKKTFCQITYKTWRWMVKKSSDLLTYLKAKNIKYSNGQLPFAAVHNIINFANKPTKQARVYFLG